MKPLLAVLLLVLLAAGGIFALQPKNEKEATPPPAPAEIGLVCYGHVDTPNSVMPLYPAQPGRVAEVLVEENQSVARDTVLLRLDDRLARIRLRLAEADVRDARAQLNQAEKAPEQHRLKIKQQQAAIEALQHDQAAVQAALDRQKNLQQSNVGNDTEVRAAEELVKKVKSGLKAERARLEELQLADPAQKLDRAGALLAAKQAQLDQAQLALDEHVLKAPADGEVLQLRVGVGSVLSGHPQQPALFFAPGKPNIVRAEIEQEFAGRVQVGLSAVVEDEYGSGAKRTGKVTSIANWYTWPRRLALDPNRLLNSDIRTVECIVTLDPDQARFRTGQRVRVVISKPSASER